MATTLRWVASSSASCFHAARQVLRGATLVDPQLAAALADGIDGLAAAIAATGLPADALLARLVPLSAGIEANRELAAVALRKVAPDAATESALNRLTASFTVLENAYRQALPDVAGQLELRSAPLCEQWEARGPGLLAAIGRLTQVDVLPEAAEVLLVYPVCGGGGEAFPAFNAATIEAVLANPHAELPEVVRLAWLIAQLNLDLPRFAEAVGGARLGAIAPLAMLPAALEAAAYVELARDDEATARLALRLWNIGTAGSADCWGVLDTWWRTYREAPTPWPVALVALDQMLAAG